MTSPNEERDVRRVLSQYENLVRAKASSLYSRIGKFEVSLELEDLMQAGRAGIVRACNTFDASKNVPFGAFVAMCVSYEIFDEYTRCFELSKFMTSEVKALEEDIAVLEQIYERPVTSTEIADFLCMTAEDFNDFSDYIRSWLPKKIPISQGEEKGSWAESWLPAKDDVVDAAHWRKLSETLAPGLDILSDRERQIILGVFFEGRSLVEIGDALGISKQRVHFVQNEALRKLRRFLEEKRIMHYE